MKITTANRPRSQRGGPGGQVRPSPPPPILAQLLKHSRCMRAHGVPNIPDSNGSGEAYVGNLEPKGVMFQNAGKFCSKETGTLSGSQPEPPGGIRVGPASVPGGGVRPSGDPTGAVPGGAVPVDNSGPGADG
jgi:hypothetical protein